MVIDLSGVKFMELLNYISDFIGNWTASRKKRTLSKIYDTKIPYVICTMKIYRRASTWNIWQQD